VPTEAGAYQEFYAGVARSLREGAAPPVTLQDAVTGLDIIEAALR
jgi:predicted dehydrogenase